MDGRRQIQNPDGGSLDILDNLLFSDSSEIQNSAEYQQFYDDLFRDIFPTQQMPPNSNPVSTQTTQTQEQQIPQISFTLFTTPDSPPQKLLPAVVSSIYSLNLLINDAKQAGIIMSIHQKYKKVFYHQNELLEVDDKLYQFNLSLLIRSCSKTANELHGIIIDMNKELASGTRGSVFVSIAKIKLLGVNQQYPSMVFEESNAFIIKILDLSGNDKQIKLQCVQTTYQNTPFYARVKMPLQQEDKVYIVMNRFIGEELYEVRFPDSSKQLTELEQQIQLLQLNIFYFGLPLLTALYELFHSYKAQVTDFGLTHGDIKLENIIANMAKNLFYVIDYETSRMSTVSLQKLQTLIGTPGYAAPEIPRGGVCAASDILSLGICGALLSGAHMDKLEKRYTGELPENEWEVDTLADVKMDETNKDSLTSIFRKMIEPDFKDRPVISKCIKDVGDLLLEERTLNLSYADKAKVEQADNNAIQMIKVIDELIENVIARPYHLLQMRDVLIKVISGLHEIPECIDQFVQRLHIKSLYGCKNKKELINQVNTVFADYYSTLTTFNKDANAKEKFLMKYKIGKISFDYLDFIQEKIIKRYKKANPHTFMSQLTSAISNNNKANDNNNNAVVTNEATANKRRKFRN